ncbi:MAG: pyruvate formate lyase family protein [Geobacteraceae bacterium]
MATAVSKTEESKYLLDPSSVGVTLGTPGMPTEEGWKWVTPEMWKFRWGVADKVQIEAPACLSDKDWYLDMTKSSILAEIYERNSNIHPADLQADALVKYLDTQRITIRPYDNLLGLGTGDEHGVPFDVLGQTWNMVARAREMAGKEKVCIWEGSKKVTFDDEKYKQLEKLAGKYNTMFKVKPELTDEEFHMYYCPEAPGRYFEPVGSGGMRANPDHDWYLPLGLRKIVELKRKKMEWFEQELKGANPKQAEDLKEKIINSKATIRATEAVIKWIKRHATEARKAVSLMPDAKAKAVLEQAAANCEWVAENAPRTFGEAVQLYWSCFLVDYQIETACGNITFRPDSTFWKWYEKDVIKDKTLSRLEAGEILACYAAKFHEIGNAIRFGAIGAAIQGGRDVSAITIGGLHADGSSAVNDLTMLILDVWDGYRFHHPDVKFRWNNKTPKAEFRRLVEVMRSGMGSPSIRNDEVVIPSMLAQYPGLVTLEEARGWGIVGCITPGPTTNSKGACRRDAQYVQILKAVEYALFNGKDPEKGFEWVHSIETGDPGQFKDFEEFYQAWLKQWEWIVSTEVTLRNRVMKVLGITLRRPFLSGLYKGCLETGDDVMCYPMPRYSFESIVGFVDSIDSLVAVKHWIYDKKKYTMAQLCEAIKAEWEGYDDMRKDFQNAPKFGNDIDYADEVMVRANNDVSAVGRTNLDIDGNPVYPSLLPISMIWHAAPYIGALPNGRKRGQALCDGGLNPQAEYDHAGTWGRMNSALKVDQAQMKAYIYNHKFDYASVTGEAGLDKMVDFALASLRGGLQLMQFNMVSREQLADAQKHPEKYPYLSVRVSGYTAFFVGLPEFMQDTIMQRVDHSL